MCISLLHYLMLNSLPLWVKWSWMMVTAREIVTVIWKRGRYYESGHALQAYRQGVCMKGERSCYLQRGYNNWVMPLPA